MILKLRLGLVITLLLCTATTAYSDGFDSGKAAFSIKVDNSLQIPYREFALYVNQGDGIIITSSVDILLQAEQGTSQAVAGGWHWTAPMKTGLYPVEVRSSGLGKISLNVFVIRPATEIKKGRLGHYIIGQYAARPYRDLPVYQAPTGFVEVQKEFTGLKISPHFTLGQFLCKQDSGWPKYLVLRPELVIKLENILEKLNREGISTDTLEIMSGYRTPWYNQTIGNRTTSSRHLYGGAADIYIDVKPRDGRMDDLNKDGKINRSDAAYLYDLLEEWSTAGWWKYFSGGLAVYGSTPAHGPFVHVDARGYRARWGH
ncbi:MAG: peptidase M15A [Gammaproteobacteria bacterium]|nr:peptidase M15A [Gammaproteobacteria bacterium]